MLPAFITHADCVRHEMGPDHPESPERLGAIKDMLLVQGLLDYMEPHEAPMATEVQLGRAAQAVPRSTQGSPGSDDCGGVACLVAVHGGCGSAARAA